MNVPPPDDTKDADMPKLPALGLVTAVVAAGIVGWLLYRGLRRRPLVQRLQDAVPGSVREIPRGIRAGLKRLL